MTKLEDSVLQLINRGMTDAEIADELGEDKKAVATMRRDLSIRGLVTARIDGKTRKLRRKAIAAFLTEGNTYEAAMEKFGVSHSAVAKAAQEFGVAKESKRVSSAEILKVAAGFVRGESNAEIGQAVGLTRERIRVLREEAEAAGLFEAIRKVVIAADSSAQA